MSLTADSPLIIASRGSAALDAEPNAIHPGSTLHTAPIAASVSRSGTDSPVSQRLRSLEVYDAYQRKGLDSLPTAATVKPLNDGCCPF